MSLRRNLSENSGRLPKYCSHEHCPSMTTILRSPHCIGSNFVRRHISDCLRRHNPASGAGVLRCIQSLLRSLRPDMCLCGCIGKHDEVVIHPHVIVSAEISGYDYSSILRVIEYVIVDFIIFISSFPILDSVLMFGNSA